MLCVEFEPAQLRSDLKMTRHAGNAGRSGRACTPRLRCGLRGVVLVVIALQLVYRAFAPQINKMLYNIWDCSQGALNWHKCACGPGDGPCPCWGVFGWDTPPCPRKMLEALLDTTVEVFNATDTEFFLNNGTLIRWVSRNKPMQGTAHSVDPRYA